MGLYQHPISCSTKSKTWKPRRDLNMEHNIYKKIEITGSSENSIEEAVRRAIERASQTIRNMRWFEVTETRGTIDNGSITEWQVTVKIGFTLEDS
jgi:dodecin